MSNTLGERGVSSLRLYVQYSYLNIVAVTTSLHYHILFFLTHFFTLPMAVVKPSAPGICS